MEYSIISRVWCSRAITTPSFAHTTATALSIPMPRAWFNSPTAQDYPLMSTCSPAAAKTQQFKWTSWLTTLSQSLRQRVYSPPLSLPQELSGWISKPTQVLAAPGTKAPQPPTANSSRNSSPPSKHEADPSASTPLPSCGTKSWAAKILAQISAHTLYGMLTMTPNKTSTIGPPASSQAGPPLPSNSSQETQCSAGISLISAIIDLMDNKFDHCSIWRCCWISGADPFLKF